MEKIAIKVSNKREFDALMQHYRDKNHNFACFNYDRFYGECAISFDKRKVVIAGIMDNIADYTIIPFPIFAQIAGIELPKEEIVIEKRFCKFRVDQFGFTQDWVGSYGTVTGDTLEEIYTAYKSLQ